MFSRFFIDRPVFATVISVVITLAGAVAVFRLPMAQYPEVTPPTVQVTAFYPGANCLTVRDTVAAPIEEQVSGVEGMLYMSSQCTNDGTYNLVITFKMGMDSDMAQVLVQNRVSLALPVIPPLVQNEGITVKKMSPNTLMIVNLVSNDPNIDPKLLPAFLSNYATIYVKDELGRIDGVAGITYLGQRDYSLRAWLDPDKLAALSLTGMDVVTAIAQQNVQVAAGQIGQPPTEKGQQFQLTITTKGRLTSPDEFADIIIKTGQVSVQSPSGSTGSPGMGSSKNVSTGIIRLRDVVAQTKGPDQSLKPKVEPGSQQYDQSCKLDDRPSVALSIFQLPGYNALDIASDVRKKMEELKKRFPEGMRYDIVYDTTPFIRESVRQVFDTLRDAVILVAIVVLLFLQDWRAMILPMIDVPVSLIGTFAVMLALGFTLNNLTLFGLVLAIGIVVDDAIVVLENIERLIATGLDARKATIKAMEEITGPIMAITLVLSAVFVPCCFLGGITGQFFRQFAVTIAVSTIISAVNAITMTPSRAVMIFKSEEETHSHNGHTFKREALPWWFFGLLGGLFSVWLLNQQVGPGFLAAELGYPLLPGSHETDTLPEWVKWTIDAVYFIPGAIVGGIIGWFSIRPINAVLGWFFRGFNRMFDRMTAGYGVVVGKTLRLSIIMLVVYGGLLSLTGFQFATAPTGFIPRQDKAYLLVNVQLADAASVDRTENVMDNLSKMARATAHGAVRNTITIAGKSLILNANASDLGSMYVMLNEDYTSRPSADEIAKDLLSRFQEKHPGSTIAIYGGPPVDGLGTTDGFKLILENRGNSLSDSSDSDSPNTDLAALERLGNKIVDAGNSTEELRGLGHSLRASMPWLRLDIDRDKCMVLGVAVSDVFSTLQIYLGSFYINNFNAFGRTWQVNVQADQKYRSRADDMRLLQVRNNQGQMVRLGTFLDVSEEPGPVMVMRYNMYSATALTGSARPGISTDDAIAKMKEIADREKGLASEWTELTYMQLKDKNVAMMVFGLAVVFVFLVLAAQYESWSLPLAVILVVPLCLLCSVTGVVLMGQEVNIFTRIGFVVLVGLASKNAILIVEFAKQLEESGVERWQATRSACCLRLRPILMTSFAFIVGVVPLVIATGPGAEMRRSLGLAVFAGMLGVTFFGVFLTPVFFYVVRRFSGSGEHHSASPP